MNYGIQYNRGAFVADHPAEVRAEFIRKVYGLFFCSLLVSVAVGAFAAANAAVFQGLWLFLFIGMVASIIALSFASRVAGWNVALLMLFAALDGALIGPGLAYYEMRFPGLPAEAGWLTIGVFGALTAYVFLSKKDFSFLGGMLFVGLIALIIAGLVAMFVQAAWLSVAYSVFGILIFSGYVLYDTSRIMQRMGPQDAVAGAVALYLDFVNLFLLILRLLSGRRG